MPVGHLAFKGSLIFCYGIGDGILADSLSAKHLTGDKIIELQHLASDPLTEIIS